MYKLIKFAVLCILFICLVRRSEAQRNCDDCQLITNCFAALELLKSDDPSVKDALLDARCGIQDTIPKVCCSEISVQGEQDIESHPNINLLSDNCGYINDIRILGGATARLYEFPWMVLISYRPNLRFECGGSLINERYVLTAAHCIVNLKIAGVRIGENDIRTETDCEGELPIITCENRIQDIQVEKAIPHEQYELLPSVKNDIGLLRLKKPVDFTAKNAGAICLPTTSQLRNRNIENETATIAGWGSTERGPQSSVLLRVNVPIHSKEACSNAYYRSYKDEGSMKNKICAGEEGHDSCKGDSGGPLMITGKYNSADRYIQYGIVSYGKGCAADYPGVYTEVSSYMKWILDNIRD